MTTVTTIHVIDQPGGGITVCTTAGTPHPGQRLTPGQALATDLLRECTHRASDVRYWQGHDKAMAFVLELSNPEGLGYADKATLHAAAQAVLGRPHGLGNPPAPSKPTTSPAAPAARLEETSRALRSSVLAWPFATTRKREPIEYELVAGERRWRACQLAGVAEIPAMIRELTDEQALEVQVVENLQREDVTELEEAEGYEVLMQHGNLSAEQVGAKIGKSRSYVYGRLKVLDLCQQGREALREGQLEFSKALLIARTPDEGLQIKALDFCTHADWQGDLPGYRECARHIQDEFMLRLDKAQFTITDATLVAEAGACGDCPKRTGANPDLFKDVDSADVCTDPKCYRAKEDAHTAQVVAAAQAKGQTVIAGEEAAELVYDAYNSKLKGYRRLDSGDDSPTDKPLRSIIGQQMEAEGIRPIIIENPRKRGDFVACLPNEVVLRLLKAVEGQAKATKEVAAEVKELVKTKQAKALEKAKAKYEQAWRDRLLDLAWAQIEGQIPHQFTADVHRYLLRREINSLSQEDAAALANILNLGKVGAHNALQDFAQTTRSPDQLHLLVIMQRDSGASHYAHGRPKNEGLMLVAGIALGDGFESAVKDSQAIAAAEHLPKATAEATTGTKQAEEPSAQPADAKAPGAKKPAALARSNARAKKSSGAAEAPKDSPQFAAANIAAALAELEEGNSEGAAAEVSAALAKLEEGQDVAPTAQGNEAPPAPAGGDAPQPDQPAGGLRVGVGVRIKPNATGKKQAPHIGKQGTVLRQISPDAWDVSIPREKRGVPLFVCFHTTELEVL